MSNVSKMEGTPWHVETLKSNSPGTRRDKRGCKFFRADNRCTKFGTCMSGRYCRFYKKDDGKEYKLSDEQIKELASIMSNSKKKTKTKNKRKEKKQTNKPKQSQIRYIKYKTNKTKGK